LPIGWDRGDLDHVAPSAPQFADDGCVHLSYVGTLLPAGFETLRALLAALAAERTRVGSAASRIRLHFFGTSNLRTSDAPPRVLPIATEYGLADIVTEHAPRLDYFDALAVLRASNAVLLLGSGERHYTPSKVFPAVVAERPVLALIHEASNAADLLQRLGRAPTIRLVTYGDEGAAARGGDIGKALGNVAAEPWYQREAIDINALEPTSACALAGRLAGLLDRCVA